MLSADQVIRAWVYMLFHGTSLLLVMIKQETCACIGPWETWLDKAGQIVTELNSVRVRGGKEGPAISGGNKGLGRRG